MHKPLAVVPPEFYLANRLYVELTYSCRDDYYWGLGIVYRRDRHLWRVHGLPEDRTWTDPNDGAFDAALALYRHCEEVALPDQLLVRWKQEAV